jgi:hypothetical protein
MAAQSASVLLIGGCEILEVVGVVVLDATTVGGICLGNCDLGFDFWFESCGRLVG